MSMKNVASVRGLALSVVLILAIVLVIIGFFLLFFGTANACRLITAVTSESFLHGAQSSNDSQLHGNVTLVNEGVNSLPDEALQPFLTSETPPEEIRQQDLSSSQYRSSPDSNSVPESTSTTSFPSTQITASTPNLIAPVTQKSESDRSDSLSLDEEYETEWDEFSFGVNDLIDEDKEGVSMETITESGSIEVTKSLPVISTRSKTSSQSARKPVDNSHANKLVPVRVNVAQIGRNRNESVSRIEPKPEPTSTPLHMHITVSIRPENRIDNDKTSETENAEKVTMRMTSPPTSSPSSSRTTTTARKKLFTPTRTAQQANGLEMSSTRSTPLQTSRTTPRSTKSTTEPKSRTLPDSRGRTTPAGTERRRPYPENESRGESIKLERRKLEQSFSPVRTGHNREGIDRRWDWSQSPQTRRPSESRPPSIPLQQTNAQPNSSDDFSGKSRQWYGNNEVVTPPSPTPPDTSRKSANSFVVPSNSRLFDLNRKESDSSKKLSSVSQKNATDGSRYPNHRPRPQQERGGDRIKSKHLDTHSVHSEGSGSVKAAQEGSRPIVHRHRVHHNQKHHPIFPPSVSFENKHRSSMVVRPHDPSSDPREINTDLISSTERIESQPQHYNNGRMQPAFEVSQSQKDKQLEPGTDDQRSKASINIGTDRMKQSNGGLQSSNVISSEPSGSKIDPRKLDNKLQRKKAEHSHRYEHQNQYDANSPVVVTALLDIGRGKWPKYTRTYEQYMNYLENLLTLSNRMVIFTDHRGAEFVRTKRHDTNTQVFEMSIADLPLFRYRDEMQQILSLEQRDWKYGENMRDTPEARSAEYDLVVNSKPYFLYNATQSSRFRANALHYTWIDAGYGHGDKRVIPLNCHWKPKFSSGLITVIQLTPKHDKISRYSINDLYRVDWSVVSGGFIAGDVATINRFYRFYYKSFLDLLDARKVDDDQTVLTMMIKNYASLFKLIHSHGDWFALFRLFPCSR